MVASAHSSRDPRCPGRGRWRRRIGRHLWTPFDIGIRCLYPIEVRGREHFSEAPSTIVVSNHRRDSDGPIIASVLLCRRGLRILGVRPYFVAREDLFRRGFLSSYLRHWPMPLRALLSHIDLRGLLEIMQALPMRRIPERSVAEVIEDLLDSVGNLSLEDALKPACLSRLAEDGDLDGGTARIVDLLDRRFDDLLSQQHGFSKLRRPCFRQLVPYERRIINAYLDRLSRLLEHGATLILEPEGAVSFDGRFGRLRGGLHNLLNRTRAAARVLPVGITYDSMTEGRKRVFVNIGSELTALQGLGRADTDTRVAAAIRRSMTVTCSQLASDYLWTLRRNGRRNVTWAEIDEYVGEEAHGFAQAGTAVDERLLSGPLRARRVGDYMTSCIRRGILTADSARRYRLTAAYCEAAASVSDFDGIVGYMRNELAAIPGHSV